jgi:hypothetical protein
VTDFIPDYKTRKLVREAVQRVLRRKMAADSQGIQARVAKWVADSVLTAIITNVDINLPAGVESLGISYAELFQQVGRTWAEVADELGRYGVSL